MNQINTPAGPASITFRQGSAADRAGLMSLRINSFSTHAAVLTPVNRELLHSTLHNERKLDELIAMSTIFVCTLDANIIGMAFIIPSGRPVDDYEASWAQLRMVGVHPSYRGLGIARSLTNMCIAHVRSLGEQVVALHTSEMMADARHIYESIGFKIVKEIAPIFGKRYWMYTLDLKTLQGNACFDFTTSIVLENDRLCIAPLTAGDLYKLAPIIANDEGLMKYSYPSVTSDTELEAYINTALQARKDKTRYPFIVFDKQTGTYAGSTSFASIAVKDKRLEIGYTWLGYNFQRTGLNRVMKYLMLQYAFETLGFSRVEFRADSRNAQSRNAIERIGATFEGELRSYMAKQDNYRSNTVIYSILQSEWPSIKIGRFNNELNSNL